MSDTNPWSAEGWNLTAQATYLKTYGRARAEARARDAGSFFGATKPPGGVKPKTQFGKPMPKLAPPPKASGLPARPPALKQPPKAIGLYTDHLTDHQKRVLYFVRRKKHQDIRLQANFALGVDADWAIKFSTPAIDLGFTFNFTAVNLYREIDVILNPGDISFAASFNMGLGGPRTVFGGVTPIFPPAFDLSITQSQPPVELAREIPHVVFDMGEDGMRAAFGNQREITANVSMGLDESWLFNEYNHGIFSFTEGLTVTAALQLEKDVAASFGVGVTEAATVIREASLSANPQLGVAQTGGQPSLPITASAALGLDEAAATSLEASVAALADFGFTEAPTVNRDRNLTAAADLGFDQITGQPAASIIAAAGVGFDDASTLNRDASLLAAASLGFDESATATTVLETVFTASASLGFVEAAIASLEKDISASADFGFDEAAFISFERDSIQDIHQGFDVNVTLQEDFHGGPYTINMGASVAANLIAEKYLTVPVAMGLSGPAANIPTVNPLLLEQGLIANPVISNSTFAAAASVTYNGVDFGTAASNRWIVALIYHGNVSATVTGVTIGGIAATSMGGDGGGVHRASLWVANVATGANGSIAINFSGNQTGCLCASYVVHGDVDSSGTQDFFESFANVSSIASQTLSNKSGGMTIGLLGANNVGVAWANGSPAANIDYGFQQPFTAGLLTMVRSLDGLNFPADGTFTTGAATGLTSSTAPYEVYYSLRPDPNPPAKLTVAVNMGLSEAAATTNTATTLVAAAPSMGFSEAAIIAREVDLVAAPSMGFSEAATAQAQAVALTVAFLQETTITQTSASFSFTGQNIGTAAADRWILCMTAFRVSSRTVSAMTIGGVTATKIGGGTAVGTNKVELWAAQVPTGTTATVDITMSGTGQSGSIMLYEVHGNLNTTSVDSRDLGNIASETTQTLNVSAGGFVIGCVLSNNVNFAWAAGVPAWNVDTTTSLSGGEIRHARHGNIESANGTHTTGACTNMGTVSYYFMASLAPQ